MKINPEERPKLIALSVGIVVMLCIFCFTVVPRLMPHGPNGPPVASTPVTTASPTAVAMALPTPAPATGASAGATPPATAAMAKDPFWRPLALSLLPANQISVPVHKPEAVLAEKTDFRLSGGSVGVGGRGGIRAASVAPPPMPDVELQGIVQDETAMAVLSVGGQARFMKAGESLEGGWILCRIQTATVVLRHGQREVVLTLGQTLPKEAPQEIREARGVAETLPPFHCVTLLP